MLTRNSFDEACKDFISKFSCSDDRSLIDWVWNEHPTLPRFGFLSRKRLIQAESHESHCIRADGGSEVVVEEEDDALATTQNQNSLLDVRQYIVYSATFQVPTFYFTMHTTSGSPLPLGDILSSPLLRASALPKTERTTFSLQQRGQLFPLLSQGEHPTLGTPCWFFHPCETPTALAELKEAGEQDDSFPGRTIMLWLLLLGNVVDLRM